MSQRLDGNNDSMHWYSSEANVSLIWFTIRQNSAQHNSMFRLTAQVCQSSVCVELRAESLRARRPEARHQPHSYLNSEDSSLTVSVLFAQTFATVLTEATLNSMATHKAKHDLKGKLYFLNSCRTLFATKDKDYRKS